MALSRTLRTSRHAGLIRLMMLSITGQSAAPIIPDTVAAEALLASRLQALSDRKRAQRRVDQIAGWTV